MIWIEEVVEMGIVFIIGGVGGDGGELIFGMKLENKFLVLVDVFFLFLG